MVGVSRHSGSSLNFLFLVCSLPGYTILANTRQVIFTRGGRGITTKGSIGDFFWREKEGLSNSKI